MYRVEVRVVQTHPTGCPDREEVVSNFSVRTELGQTAHQVFTKTVDELITQAKANGVDQ